MQKVWKSAKDRPGLLYLMGAEPWEIDKCLSESRKRLVAAGAKADNLPVGIKQRVRFLVGLSPKAGAIVRDWFKKKAVFGDLDVVSALEIIQSSSEDMDEEAAKVAWRALLRAHIHGEEATRLSAFLAGEIENKPEPTAISITDAASVALEITEDDANLCIAIADGRPPFVAPKPIPTFISGILACMHGDQGMAAECVASLSAHSSPIVRKLGLAISTLEANENHSPSRIPAIKIPLYARGMVDAADNIPFIGVVKKVLPQGQIFVSLCAMHINGKWIEVSPIQAKEVFPSSGDATASPHSIPGTFVEGEFGIWTAELKSPDKGTQYVITQHLGRVYCVYQVPHSSMEPDGVRKWLVEMYKPSPGIFPLFHLSDGAALRLPGGLSDVSKFNFDTPLDSYRGLESIEIRAGQQVLAPTLPSDVGKFHCEPPGTLIKRLFKQAKEHESVPTLAKAQLQSLANFANLISSQGDQESYIRALKSLDNATDAKAFLDETISLILDLPEIKERIEIAIADLMHSYETEQLAVKNEIFTLTEKRRVLEAELDSKKTAAQAELEKLKKSGRQQEAELEKRIKTTFDKAAAGGLETLANAALWKAIIGLKTDSQIVNENFDRPVMSSGSSADDFNSTYSEFSNTALQSKRAFIAAITNHADQLGLSETMILSAIAIAAVQPAIGFTGQNTRKVINALSTLISGGVLCEVSVSADMFSVSDLMNAPALIRADSRGWTSTLGEFLGVQTKAGRASIIELRGINRVPPESLLPELSVLQGDDEIRKVIYWKDTLGSLRHISISAPVLFALTFVAGKSVFPIQGELAECMPILHTDGTWGDEREPTVPKINNSTSVSAEVWNALSAAAPNSKPRLRDWKARVTQAVEEIGFSNQKAQALVSLAYLIGRVPAEDLRSKIESLAPDLSRYASEVSVGNTARAFRQIFDSEIGVNDE